MPSIAHIVDPSGTDDSIIKRHEFVRWRVGRSERVRLVGQRLGWLPIRLRQASVRAGDPQGVNVWAGTGFRNAKSATVADIMAGLT
jgi:nitronate monooxygenase